MRHAGVLILNRPRLILAMLSLFMVAELGVAFADVLPVEHEGLLRWLLILTTLAWMSIARFTGMVAPIGRETVEWAYRVLVVLPCVIPSNTINVHNTCTS